MSERKCKYEVEKVTEQFESCISSREIRIKEYIRAYREINKFFDQLGSFFVFVKDDVESKCSILERHLTGPNKAMYETVASMVSFEISCGIIEPEPSVALQNSNLSRVATLSGEPISNFDSNSNNMVAAIGKDSKNNSLDLKKESSINSKHLDKISYDNLPSGSRSLLRLHRALKFVIQLFPKLLDSDPKIAIRHVIRDLYDETLAIFHPWLVKKAVHFALFTACPSREKMLSIVACDETKEDIERKSQRLSSVGMQVFTMTQTTYEENNILNLQ